MDILIREDSATFASFGKDQPGELHLVEMGGGRILSMVEK